MYVFIDYKIRQNVPQFHRHGVKVGRGPRDPTESFKVGPETPVKFKSGTPGPPTKFKSGTFIITFLHCYLYNMEIIFHE